MERNSTWTKINWHNPSLAQQIKQGYNSSRCSSTYDESIDYQERYNMSQRSRISFSSYSPSKKLERKGGNGFLKKRRKFMRGELDKKYSSRMGIDKREGSTQRYGINSSKNDSLASYDMLGSKTTMALQDKGNMASLTTSQFLQTVKTSLEGIKNCDLQSFKEGGLEMVHSNPSSYRTMYDKILEEKTRLKKKNKEKFNKVMYSQGVPLIVKDLRKRTEIKHRIVNSSIEKNIRNRKKYLLHVWIMTFS